jgi:hypothetical protein
MFYGQQCLHSAPIYLSPWKQSKRMVYLHYITTERSTVQRDYGFTVGTGEGTVIVIVTIGDGVGTGVL